MYYKNPIQMLTQWAETQPNNIFLRDPIGESDWNEFDWQTSLDMVNNIATSIHALDIEPGSRIAILNNNSAYWVLCDLAIMLAGMVSVPLYTQQKPETINYVLKHCDAKVIFMGHLDHFNEFMAQIPEKITKIVLPDVANVRNCINWNDFIAKKSNITLTKELEPNATASIIYTSGTTGKPKGVMHSIKNFSFAATNFVGAASFTKNDTFFSYLPLSHIAERMFVEMICLYCGGMISFNQSLSTFAARLKKSAPSFILGVPRIWTKLQEAVLAKLPAHMHPVIFEHTAEADTLKKSILDNLGFANMRFPASGAAPIAPDLLKWFHALGLPILEGYAQTENCAYCTLNPFDNFKIGTVGPALPDTEIKIDANHEVLMKNEAVMQGYYRQPDETAAAITADGFLRTGDIGNLDQDGYLTITGRIKDLFKTSKGKYVAPVPIENQLANDPLIAQVCIVGSSLPQPVALIVLSEISHQKNPTDIEDELKSLLSRTNKTLEKHEKISKIIICTSAWDVANDLATPTQKIKRHAIEEFYKELVTTAETKNSAIIWEKNVSS